MPLAQTQLRLNAWAERDVVNELLGKFLAIELAKEPKKEDLTEMCRRSVWIEFDVEECQGNRCPACLGEVGGDEQM